MTRVALLVKPFTKLCMKGLRVSVSRREQFYPLFSLEVVAHWEVTVLILSILAETSAFSHVNIKSCAQPQNARIPKYMSFGGRVTSLAI